MQKEPVRKTDRRVIRTRKAIMDAFDTLLSQGSPGRITVSAIAREANIDRKTFYLHYASVNELATRKAEIAFERILEAIKECGEKSSPLVRLEAALDELNAVVVEDLEPLSAIAPAVSVDQFIDRVASAIPPAMLNVGFESSLSNGVVCESFDDCSLPLMVLQFNIAGTLSLYKSWLTSDHTMPIEMVSNAVLAAVRSQRYYDSEMGEATGA